MIFQPILDQIHKLWARVATFPTIRKGFVSQVSPLMIHLDGSIDTAGLPVAVPAQSLVKALRVGDRVVCAEQNRRVTVLSTADGIRLFASKSALDAWSAPDGALAFVTADSQEYVRVGGAWTARVTAFAEAVGWVNVSALTAGGSEAVSVTFPVGRFSTVPRVQLTPNNTRLTTAISGVSASGCTVNAANWSPSGSSAAFVYWHAVQMAAGSADG